MSRFTACLVFLLLVGIRCGAQPVAGWDRAPFRSEFISYSQREAAEADDRSSERYFYPVESISVQRTSAGNSYEAELQIPNSWLEREVLLHCEGSRNSHIIYVNGKLAGSARDSRLPSEFNISPFLRAGFNTVKIEVPQDTAEPESGTADNRPEIETLFVYSQPRIRIEDYRITATPAFSDGRGTIKVELMLRNGYNYAEKVTVGYDVYSPDGKLQHYDLRDVTIPGRSADTIRLSASIYGIDANLWSASSPNLYRIMLLVRRNGIMAEYIPVKAGFVSLEYESGRLIVNGKAEPVKPAVYNAVSPQSAVTDVRRLKKEGINTLLPDYPQPHWFYEICNREGMYVVDRANINTPGNAGNRRIGGTLSNDPRWLEEYLSRIGGMYARSRNHPCVVGWSPASPSGNGYNMYKAYQWLKERDDVRPVIYPGAAGEWNSDALEGYPAEPSGSIQKP